MPFTSKRQSFVHCWTTSAILTLTLGFGACTGQQPQTIQTIAPAAAASATPYPSGGTGHDDLQYPVATLAPTYNPTPTPYDPYLQNTLPSAQPLSGGLTPMINSGGSGGILTSLLGMFAGGGGGLSGLSGLLSGGGGGGGTTGGTGGGTTGPDPNSNCGPGG